MPVHGSLGPNDDASRAVERVLQAERDAEQGGQDVDAPTVEADRVGVRSLAAADPRLRARLNGRAQAGERARHRVSGHGDGF